MGKDIKNVYAAADHGYLLNQITSRAIKQLRRQTVINNSVARLTIRTRYPVWAIKSWISLHLVMNQNIRHGCTLLHICYKLLTLVVGVFKFWVSFKIFALFSIDRSLTLSQGLRFWKSNFLFVHPWIICIFCLFTTLANIWEPEFLGQNRTFEIIDTKFLDK